MVFFISPPFGNYLAFNNCISIKGSYTFNNILLEYKQIGPQFYTFGNPYMTNNIREFTIKDRLSLLERRLMFVVGYSSKDNNLSEIVLNPLKTQTFVDFQAQKSRSHRRN